MGIEYSVRSLCMVCLYVYRIQCEICEYGVFICV